MADLKLALPGGKGKIKLPVMLIAGAVILVAVIVTGLIISGLSASLENADKENEELRAMIEQLKEELDEANKIDVAYVGNRLDTISQLAVAEMTYNGMIHFKEGNIPFIDLKEFYMAYTVSLKAGYDLSAADIKVTENTVTITLPEAEIYEPNVDETSIRFFDQTTSWFNAEQKDDLIEAITAAKEDVLVQPETERMKETARLHVEVLIKALFEGQIGDRDLILNIG